jgi:hypothetical protein
MPALAEVFQYVPLTEMVTRVMGGIPKVLPEGFYALTRDIPGDRYRRTTFRGTRQLALVSRYGSPPRNTRRVSHGMQDLVMLHQIEQVQASSELLQLVRKWDTYEAQQLARDLLQQDAIEFGARGENLRTAAIQAGLAFGKLWFDAEGNLLTSSGSADLEIDYRIPASNTGQVNPGGGNIIDASWAVETTNIPRHVLNIKTAIRQKCGRELKYAFMGKNVPGYLATNASFREYLARNPVANQKYIDTGTVPDGTLGLTWVPVQDAFFADANDAVTELFPADQVTFFPEIGRDTYELAQGGYPVPKSFAVASSLEEIAEMMEYVYGPFKYAYMMPGHMQINMAQGDTFLPDFKIPESIVLADTTP